MEGSPKSFATLGRTDVLGELADYQQRLLEEVEETEREDAGNGGE